MKIVLKIFLLIILIGIISLAIFAIDIYKNAASQENGIVAVNEEMKIVHNSILADMKSKGLSVEKYGCTVLKAIDTTASGRYGQKRTYGVIILIKVQNKTIDSVSLEKLQTVIEAGYNRFEETRRIKTDRIRTYDRFMVSSPKGRIARALGFPKKVTPDMHQTISTAEMTQIREMFVIDTSK